MKKLTLITSLLITSIAFSQLKYNTDEERFFSVWVDPTLTDRGQQIGLSFTKEMLWGFVDLSVSHYAELKPSYTDAVVTFGFANTNYRETINWYNGIRIGSAFRESQPHGIVGASTRLQYQIFKGFYIGFMLWVDYRADQADQFYGDASAHEYFIFSNPMTQENGAVYISVRF